MKLWTEIADDLDLPDDGLLATPVGHPYDKPRIRLVPVELDYKAAEEAFSERSTDSRSIVDAALRVGEETPFAADIGCQHWEADI